MIFLPFVSYITNSCLSTAICCCDCEGSCPVTTCQRNRCSASYNNIDRAGTTICNRTYRTQGICYCGMRCVAGQQDRACRAVIKLNIPAEYCKAIYPSSIRTTVVGFYHNRNLVATAGRKNKIKILSGSDWCNVIPVVVPFN